MEPASNPSQVVRFGLFEADLRTGELLRNGVRVKMQDLPFRALRLFLLNPGQVLNREDLRRALWPEGVHVDFDRGISTTISRLRDSLGDNAANPIFLETVDRLGYRWIAPVSPRAEVEAPAARPGSVVPIFGDAHRSPTDEEHAESTDFPDASETVGQDSARASGNIVRRWLILLLIAAGLAAAILWTVQRGSHKSSAPSTRGSADPQAEDLYLKGRYYWNKRTPDDLNKAVEFFDLSLAHDPNYANAYVGLADCYNLLREFSAMPPEVAFPRALASAKKAVELDPSRADAHASLGFVLFSWNWDRAGAEREFKRAIELDPDNARAHHWWATTLLAMRRLPEALQQIEIAQQLDPSSSAILADKALILSYVGRRADALTLLHQVVEEDATLASAHSYLSQLYLKDGDYPSYLDEITKAAQLQHNEVALAQAAAARKGFSTDGLPGMYAALLPLQLAAYQQGHGQAFPLAETYLHLNRRDDALRMLREAYERREQPILLLDDHPDFDALKGNPEYEDILKKSRQPRE